VQERRLGRQLDAIYRLDGSLSHVLVMQPRPQQQ